ncbi:MAG: ABC transporter ATP-binding protein [Chloroflexota bacterium]|nr:MAG: ABC transporter ATP-binding protein [Chloroflexota bacterium]
MIELKNIVKIYTLGEVKVAALNGVDCNIKTGEIVSIMGPSGSGKSTLMNLIGCLDRPTSGTYLLDGTDVSRLNDDQLAAIRNKKIGFVFQSFNLLPQATAVANVELPLVYSGTGNKRQRASEALELVGMAQRATHRPSEISGGEQQRVAIARALVNNPSLILADEPTGNLDTQTSKGIMLLLQRLNNQGITIILVTHEEDIAAYTQRTIYLRDGKIVSEKKR